MAIQKIGNTNVYVITGSGKDPRLTSSGQSWADLVTQQKYMLLREAQKEALRQMREQQLSFQDRQKQQEQLRKNLLDQIEAERKGIEDLRTEQISLNEAREIENQRIKARSPEYKGTRESAGSTTVTRSIPTEREYTADLRREISDQTLRQRRLQADRTKLVEAEKEGKTYAEVAPELLSTTELQDLANFDQAKAKLDEGIQNSQDAQASAQQLRTDYEDSDETARQDILNKAAKKTIRTSGGGGGTRSRAPTKTLEDLPEFRGFDPEIERRQQRIKDLQTELDALEFEERPTFDGIEETRRVYREAFPDRQRRGLRDRIRRRTEPAPSPAPIVEQPMQPGPNLAQMESYGVTDSPMMIGGDTGNMSRQIGRQAEMEALDMPFEFLPSEVEIVGEEPTAQTTETFTDDIAEPRIQPATDDIPEPRITPSIGIQPSAAVSMLPSRTGPAGAGFRPDVMPTPYQGERFVEQMILGIDQAPQQVNYLQQFDDVKFGTVADKQMRARELIFQASQQFGPSNPQYIKAKDEIFDALEKTMNPKEYRKQKKVKRVMDKNPQNYTALANTVRGLTEDTTKLVMALFPAQGETDLKIIDDMYTAARRQLTYKGDLNPQQRKKGLEFLELYYLAIIDENQSTGV